MKERNDALHNCCDDCIIESVSNMFQDSMQEDQTLQEKKKQVPNLGIGSKIPN